ncbi:hypothetical protein CsatB_028275 [Cannabis sativa]
MASSMADEDRISKLPDALITHILSFLPTEEVVRTCLLSKRWKLIWYSVPTIFFSNDKNRDDLEKLYNYVDKYVEQRKRGMEFMVDSDITSFVLNMYGECERSKTCLIDKWLGFVLEKKVKKIKLYPSLDPFVYYSLPKIFFENARYLTILKLHKIELDTSYSGSFPSLKTLVLDYVQISDTTKNDGVFKFLLGCPSLERLRLRDAEFYDVDDQLRLQSSSLKFMEFGYLNIYHESCLQVAAVNLESLVLDDVSLNKIDLSSCKNVRNLSLDDCFEDEESSIQDLISSFPLLEHLSLSFLSSDRIQFLINYYYGSDSDSDSDSTEFDQFSSKQLKISNQHLKSLNVRQYDDDYMIITIESAPELTSFRYDGEIHFSLSLESSNLLNGTFHVYEHRSIDSDTSFTNMMKFLSNLNCSWNVVSLRVHKAKALIFSEKLKNICSSPLINWKHLKLVLGEYDPERLSDLKDSLMWISPSLETLSINGKEIF